jgi:hypothetical protein
MVSWRRSNTPYLAGIGVDHTQSVNGCPMWPYIGAHIFSAGPTGTEVPAYAPANGYGVAVEYRADAITYPGQYGCGGGNTISSITASGGNETLNGVSQGTCGAGTIQIGGSGICAGATDFIQVTGSSVAADNSTPGTVLKTTSLNTTSGTITFANASAANCSSSCGNVAFAWQEGPAPYTVPNGYDGNPPAVIASVNRTGSGGGSPISWSLLGQLTCGPLLACPYSGGCGLWSTGAAGNSAYQ